MAQKKFQLPSIYYRDFGPKHHESECVASLDYDELEQTLTIEFQQRGTYVYRNFPLDEWLLFNGAASRGEFFNLYIRNAGYEYERIG